MERFDFWMGPQAAVLEVWQHPSKEAARAFVQSPSGGRDLAYRQTVGNLAISYACFLPDSPGAQEEGRLVSEDLGCVGGVRLLLGPLLRSRFGIELLPGALIGEGALELSRSLRDIPRLRDHQSFAHIDARGGFSRFGDDDRAEFLGISR
jgi:hypothetical protein